jgi:DNA adenine methylase
VKPPIAYYGGKSRLAPWLTSLFPPHRVYVEPFAGSAAVLFAKTRSVHEIINDRDGDLVNFLKVLRDQPDEFEHLCRLTPYSRDEWAACAAIDAPSDLERARQWWVRSSQAFGQVAKVNTGWSTSIQRGSNNARSVWNRLGRFGPCAERLGGVVIENRHAFEVIEKYDAADGVIYLDPPYLAATRTSYAGGRRPNGDYAVEFALDSEHIELAKRAHDAKAMVLVSGYPSDLYEELYGGWARLERRVMRRLSNGRAAMGGKRQLSHADEVVWSNRPLPASLLTDVDAF